MTPYYDYVVHVCLSKNKKKENIKLHKLLIWTSNDTLHMIYVYPCRDADKKSSIELWYNCLVGGVIFLYTTRMVSVFLFWKIYVFPIWRMRGY